LTDLAAQSQTASDRCSALHPDRKLAVMADAYLAFVPNTPTAYGC